MRNESAYKKITVIGGGLAGVEAAYTIASSGIEVDLYEMRPTTSTPAHESDQLAELVCSNSLKSEREFTASGLLKAEMEKLGSIVLSTADVTRVPAGNALAVDREQFAQSVTSQIENTSGINVIRRELCSIPDGVSIIATGPLTSPAMSERIAELVGDKHLYFYDAIAPTIKADSIDENFCFAASRYDIGTDDYVNCPMTKQEYYDFVEALVSAEPVPLPEYEEEIFFEGCLPIEEIARRGKDSLRFGPFKPVGLEGVDKSTRQFAVLQLRREDSGGQYFNLVGCQTRLRQLDQKKALSIIPALKNAEFVRFGQAHRNTYVNGPRCLFPTLQLRNHSSVFLAGQITGVEGYIESAAMGIIAGINAARITSGKRPVYPPRNTIIGALLRYISLGSPVDFTPRNAMFGILPPPPAEAKGKQERRKALWERASKSFDEWVTKIGLR